MANKKYDAIVNFTRSSGYTAEIDVYAGEADESIAKELFGKFTEHMGRNIYHGMWAQILKNPSFEPFNFFADKISTLTERLEHEEKLFPGIELVKSFWQGVAYRWARYGKGDISYNLAPDCIGSWSSQHLVIHNLETYEAGICQPIFLPTHREQEYLLSLWLKSDVKNLSLSIEEVDGERNRICEEEIGRIGPKWRKFTKRLRVKTRNIDRGTPLVFSISSRKTGTIFLDHCLLFPKDNVAGFDYDVVRLAKESNLTLLRYPGGNFASQYHWKDGIGDVENRPIRLNEAWNIVEYNHVGIDEIMKFCASVGCEPLICVNSGTGTPSEAAEWLEYCNGNQQTRYGTLRAKNGHLKPYNIRFWEIGNELYGSWQKGYCGAEEYAERHQKYFMTMSRIDPRIKIIANGFGRSSRGLKWNKILMEKKGDIIRSLSAHLLVGGGVSTRKIGDDELYLSLLGFTHWLRQYLDKIQGEALASTKHLKIAITELQIFTKQANLPNNKTLAEALFYSGMVNTSIIFSDLVELITHSALMNHGGGLNKSREIVYPDPVYYARKLYSTQPGVFPVKTNVATPMYKTRRIGGLPTLKDVPYLDVISLLNREKNLLSILVCNRHPYESIEANFCFHNFKIRDNFESMILNGASYMASNTWKNPNLVKTRQNTERIESREPCLSFPPHSITNLVWKRI